MSLKYKIVYDDYSKYQIITNRKPVGRYLITVLLCIAIVLFVVCCPDKKIFYDLFLPGDPAVTTDAFQQLAEALDRGEVLADALDAFCNTVMDVR